ncbi:hypothetical protein ACFVIM_14420 [Streptomyces sp. NPDC057638]|uniref:hypothetical protein n=1 Tax=Streptomyces sp. NPDC057638 TaxID=3346190 RepID=UPI0036B8483B
MTPMLPVDVPLSFARCLLPGSPAMAHECATATTAQKGPVTVTAPAPAGGRPVAALDPRLIVAQDQTGNASVAMAARRTPLNALPLLKPPTPERPA